MYILGALLPSPPAVDTTNKKSGVLAGPTPVRGVLLPGHLSICRGFLVSSVWPIHIWCKHAVSSIYVGTAAVDIKATTNRYPVVIHGRKRKPLPRQRLLSSRVPQPTHTSFHPSNAATAAALSPLSAKLCLLPVLNPLFNATAGHAATGNAPRQATTGIAPRQAMRARGSASMVR